jgi:hypothetical protein
MCTYSQIIKQNFTDTDEKEHYLKKMLASNKVVRGATREWFNLKNEEELMNTLNLAVEKDSQIKGWDKNNDWEKIRIRRAHEALYKVPKLQDWMQETESIRFDWSGEHLYISRPRSWYNWIMLDTYRNEVIGYLLSKAFSTEHKNEINKPISYFWGGNIILLGQVFGCELKLTFNTGSSLKIERKVRTEEWQVIKSYNYVNEDVGMIEILEKEIFDKNSFSELIKVTEEIK